MKRCLIYGDSLLYGFDPESGHKGGRYPEDLRVTGILERELTNWEFVIATKVGRCIPSMDFELEEFEGILKSTGDIDLFAVMLGTNDYLSYSKPDVERVSARMRKFLMGLLDRASYISGRTKVLLIAPPCLNFRDDIYYKKFTTLDGRLSKVLKDLAKDLNVYFVDSGSITLPVGKDGIHLTLEAQEPLAKLLISVIKKL